MTSSQVRALVEREIGGRWHWPDPDGIDLRQCLIEPERLELLDARDQPFEAWLIVRSVPGCEGYGLIYEPDSGSFGLVVSVASGVPVFIGLYGDIFDTLSGM